MCHCMCHCLSLQLCNSATLQLCNSATPQPCNPASTSMYFNGTISYSQYFSPAAFRLKRCNKSLSGSRYHNQDRKVICTLPGVSRISDCDCNCNCNCSKWPTSRVTQVKLNFISPTDQLHRTTYDFQTRGPVEMEIPVATVSNSNFIFQFQCTWRANRLPLLLSALTRGKLNCFFKEQFAWQKWPPMPAQVQAEKRP